MLIYPITENYVQDWTELDAARELIANAMDTKDYSVYLNDEDELCIVTRSGKIAAEALLLGHSTKDSSFIGQFGEGLKLAMLVFARAGTAVTFINHDALWEFSFEKVEGLSEPLLVHREHPVDDIGEVRIVIRGLPIDKLKDNTLALRDVALRRITTLYGTLLLNEQRGRIYLGGLFVCDTDCKYSYDFNTDQLQMNRDRKTLSQFNLEWQLRDLLVATGRTDLIAAMLYADRQDTRGFAHRPIQIPSTGGLTVVGRAYLACVGANNTTQPLDQRVKDFYKNNSSRMTPLARKRYRQELLN